MNSTNPNIALGRKYAEHIQHQRKHGFFYSRRDGIDRKNNLRDDDPFQPIAGNMVFGCEGEPDTTANFFDMRKLGREGIQHMAGFYNRSFHGTLAHRSLSRNGTTLTSGYFRSRRSAEMAAAKRATWLTFPASFEAALEELTEQTDSKLQHSRNRSSILLRRERPEADVQIDCKKGCANSRGETDSEINQFSHRGRAPHPTIPTEGASITRRDNSPIVSPTNSQSGSSGSSAELGRDLPPDTSEKYSSKFISPLFFCLMAKIPTAVVADFDTRQSTEGNRYEHPS